jgi:hypothetical protein
VVVKEGRVLELSRSFDVPPVLANIEVRCCVAKPDQ